MGPDPVVHDGLLEEGRMAAGSPAERRDRLAAKGDGSLRVHTARGVMINAAFTIGLTGLSLLRGLLVAVFLAPSDYGVWAVIVIAFTTLGVFKQVGIVDKYIQQDETDEEAAFQKAFTLEASLSAGLAVVMLAATPLLAIVYDLPELVAPTLVSLLALPGSVLQAPVWTYVREMEFKKQRLLSSVDPVVAALVTVAAAIAGAGYWAFVIGTVAGAWTGAAVVMRHAVYPLRFRYDRGTAREYLSFSFPLLVSGLGNSVLVQGTTLVARSAVGVAGLGAMSLANSIRVYTEFADGIISSTMYPAICTVKDRRDLLFESFVKSNRLALMWGVPLGMGAALFAADALLYVLGDEWTFATVLFQAVGVVSAVYHVGFNWDSYVRALGDTRPIAVYAWIGVAAWTVAPVPLLLTEGFPGYSVGLLVAAAVALAIRGYYLRRLFPGFKLARHAVRAVAPTVLATGLVLGARSAFEVPRSPGLAAAELLLYVVVVVIVTWFAERKLLREAIDYVRRARSGAVQLAG